ncbi:MAG TPA: NUDIX domain-containing protein [Microbacteriaceae bacterium]|nr:NUDIX domain-containing protein [Microbacteriaceae bacterium]
MSEKAVYAAGAVVWREIDGKVHVLLVHRTQYGDITIPKGKVDPGESLPQTAVREIAEETGISVNLGVPLGISRYTLGNGREKIVHYWAAHARSKAIRESSFSPNGEIAALEWLPLRKARKALSYEPDVEILDAFTALVDDGIRETFALLVARHGKAQSPDAWQRDGDRPLTERGVAQAHGLVGTMAAFGPKRIISSTALRCATTVAPLAVATGLEVVRTELISQSAYEDGTADVRRIVGKRVRSGKTAVLCSHGPVIPEILREIALATATPVTSAIREAAALDTGGLSVVHLSQDHPASGIITIESYAPFA